jgi:Holliday junction resolvasome RuvABC endonuclease subunit
MEMTKFEENRLREFIKELRVLVDEFHPHIYTINKVFKGLEMIEIGISDEIEKPKNDKETH